MYYHTNTLYYWTYWFRMYCGIGSNPLMAQHVLSKHLVASGCVYPPIWHIFLMSRLSVAGHLTTEYSKHLTISPFLRQIVRCKIEHGVTLVLGSHRTWQQHKVCYWQNRVCLPLNFIEDYALQYHLQYTRTVCVIFVCLGLVCWIHSC
jgi:hypothetical protein